MVAEISFCLSSGNVQSDSADAAWRDICYQHQQTRSLKQWPRSTMSKKSQTKNTNNCVTAGKVNSALLSRFAALGKNPSTLLQKYVDSHFAFNSWFKLSLFFSQSWKTIDRPHCVFVLWENNCKYLVVNSTCVKNNCELHTVHPRL